MNLVQSRGFSLSIKTDATAKDNIWRSFSFQEYENEIAAYFLERSPNAACQINSERLRKRFENSCMQIREGIRFIEDRSVKRV